MREKLLMGAVLIAGKFKEGSARSGEVVGKTVTKAGEKLAVLRAWVRKHREPGPEDTLPAPEDL